MTTARPIRLADLDLPFVDLDSTDFRAEPHRMLRAYCRPELPFVRTVRGVEVLSYDLIWNVLSNKLFDSPPLTHDDAVSTARIDSWFRDGLLLHMPPDKHDRVRRAVVKPFTGRRIAELRSAMRDIAESLIDELPTGEVDLVAEFTHHYSIRCLCLLLGVPASDIPKFEASTLDLRLGGSVPFAPVVARFDAALEGLWEYCRELVDRRRREPTDDFLGSLVSAFAAEQGMSEPELVWGIANLLFAGHDTTRHQLASCVRALIEHDRWARVCAEPGLVPEAVDEGCRLYPVVLSLQRVALTDAVVGRFRIPEGQVLHLNMMAAARDPARFDRPDEFQLPRTGPSYPATFGWGAHRCVGHALARTEMIEAVWALGNRFGTAEFTGPISEHPLTGRLGGPICLPVRLSG